MCFALGFRFTILGKNLLRNDLEGPKRYAMKTGHIFLHLIE
jgi:hypothetical protein